MKALFKIIAVIIVVLIIYAYFYNSFPSQDPSPAVIPSPAPANASPATPPVNAPPGMPVLASPTETILPSIQNVAAQTGVTIKSIHFNGKNVPVALDWIGDVATVGGDFIEQLLRQGIIRDFEDVPGKRRWYDGQGRSHFHQSFILKLP